MRLESKSWRKVRRDEGKVVLVQLARSAAWRPNIVTKEGLKELA